MPIFEAVRLALSQLRVQKLKSFFTLLGVTISVMFLIAVVSIVEGMNKYVEQDIRWRDASSLYRKGGAQVIAQAITPDFYAIKDLVVAKGRPHGDLDEQLGSNVVVIGSEIASHYFPNLDPIDRE